MQDKPDTVQLQAYNLAEYSELAQKHLLDGYRFDFVSNSHFPTSFGSFFTCTMVLQKESPEKALEPPVAASESATEGQVPVATKGRPKKV